MKTIPQSFILQSDSFFRNVFNLYCRPFSYILIPFVFSFDVCPSRSMSSNIFNVFVFKVYDTFFIVLIIFINFILCIQNSLLFCILSFLSFHLCREYINICSFTFSSYFVWLCFLSFLNITSVEINFRN